MNISKSVAITSFKTLVILGLILTVFVGFSQQKSEKKYTPNENGIVALGNNKLEYTKSKIDTMDWEDPVTHKMIIRIIKTDPYVEKVDGKIIEDLPPAFKDNSSPAEYLYRKMKNELSGLEDGFYYVGLRNLIVDDKGKTCAFTYDGVSGNKTEDRSKARQPIEVDKQLDEKIFNKICNELANFPTWQPPVVKGKKAVSEINPFGDWSRDYQLKIQGHKVYFKTNAGWIEL